MFSLCGEVGVEVSYNDDEQGFTFEFSRTPVNPMYASEAESRLNAEQLAVYRLMKKNDKITAEEIAAKIAKSPRTVYRIIDELKETGFVERVGKTKGSRWKLLK